ncbi:hypothetical protein ACHAXT_002453 [Thalassiosira profunda]
MARHCLWGPLALLSALHNGAWGFTFTSGPVPRRASTLCRSISDTSSSAGVAIEESSGTDSPEKLRVVVVGGGWAGYSLCESISTNSNVEIILLDAQKQAKGGLAGGYRRSNGRPAEAGIHGFWREYRNTFAMMECIERRRFATKDFDKLRGVTCVAVRLFLKPDTTTTSNLDGGSHGMTQLPPEMAKAMKDSPIAVCGASIGGIDELQETGFCFYDLQRMHDEFSVGYQKANVEEDAQVAVLEVDFYRADAFVDYDDDAIIDLALRAVSAALGTEKISADAIVDSTVIRARNAVSHFAPNSALYSPDVKLDKGLYMCGDWVDRTGHASWSTEKSVVTARQAAASLSGDFGLIDSQCEVVPAAKDTPQLTVLRQATRLLRSVLPPKTLPPSPWVLAKQLLSGERGA